MTLIDASAGGEIMGKNEVETYDELKSHLFLVHFSV